MDKMFKVAVIEGDGIGPEILAATMLVLEKAINKYSLNVEFIHVEAGDSAVKKYGEAIPESSWSVIKSCDAILKGPVGESAGDVVVKIRRGLDLYANIRPAKTFPGVKALKPGTDLVIVRENTEDVYIRAEHMIADGVSIALRLVTKKASERIARKAFELASKRRRKVTVVHKANVLTLTDGLFKRVAYEVGRGFPNIEIDEMYIDAAVMDLVRKPERFDVIVTTNLYGDILSDLAAYVTGSIGLAASANMGDEKAMFEPIHGAAFDIAGKGVANPTAMMLSAAWMLKWLGERGGGKRYIEAGEAVEKSIESVLSEGKILTPDLGGSANTMSFAEAVAMRI
jgi:3-isopropylmalate dehydrogenase